MTATPHPPAAETPHPWLMRILGAAATVGILGWVALLGLFGWWLWQPTNLPDVTEPIRVLNPDHAVPVNTSLILELEISKTSDVNPVRSSRFLECESGNLVTLTSAPVPLPLGSYDLISDSIVIPAKVTAGDTCRAVFAITYQINPIRDEVSRFESEPFDVLPAESPTL